MKNLTKTGVLMIIVVFHIFLPLAEETTEILIQFKNNLFVKSPFSDVCCVGSVMQIGWI